MSAPSVYAAINAVSLELAANGVPKRHLNEIEDYRYRSIDDLQIGSLPFWRSTGSVFFPERSNGRSWSGESRTGI